MSARKTAARVRYDRLTHDARDTIRAYGITIADYVRTNYPDGDWRGDACGCTHERCTGYHHDPTDDCGCLPVLLDNFNDHPRDEEEANR